MSILALLCGVTLTLPEQNRNNIAAAKLAGLEADLHLSSVEYSTAVSILFVGYLLMQIPSNLLLNKLGKPALYLPTCVCLYILHYLDSIGTTH